MKTFNTTIKVLNKAQINVRVTDAKVPNVHVAKIPGYLIKDEYWLHNSLDKGAPYYYAPLPDAVFKCCDFNLIKGIRPIVTIENNAVENLSEGADILVGDKWLFRMIDDTHAFCCTVIGYSIFDTIPLHKDIEDTVVYKYIQTWFNNIRNKPVYRITYKEAHRAVMNYDCIRMPYTSEVLFLNDAEFPCWTWETKNEFCGRIVESPQNALNAEYSTSKTQSGQMLNICPVIQFDKMECLLRPLKCGDLISCGGRLFKVFSGADRAIGINSVGSSCFSTGFCDIKTDSSRDEFRYNSEAYALLRNWLENISG